jgi:hypothetical protein
MMTPVWSRNIMGLLAHGYLNTVPNMYWGFSPWIGLILYLDLALPMLGLMLWWTRRAERRGSV